MQASELLRWADRAQTDSVWRDFGVFGRSSPCEERSALASPSSSPSRTRPPLHPLSAHDGAQGPIDGGCTHSSGPGPAPYSARILFPRRHHPHLALLDGTAIPEFRNESDRADCILFPRLGGLLTMLLTGGTRIRNGLFHRGWITPVLGVCRYSDRSHFEATAAVHTISEGFRLEFPSA